MKIIQAKSEDLSPIRLAQIEAFMNAGFQGEKISRVFDKDRFLAMWTLLLEGGKSLLLLLLDGDEVVGLLGGCVQEDILTSHIMGAEMNWRVSHRGKGQGMKLLDLFETWAEERGATRLLVHLRADHRELSKLRPKLLARGYGTSGFQFLKEVRR